MVKQGLFAAIFFVGVFALIFGYANAYKVKEAFDSSPPEIKSAAVIEQMLQLLP